MSFSIQARNIQDRLSHPLHCRRRGGGGWGTVVRVPTTPSHVVDVGGSHGHSAKQRCASAPVVVKKQPGVGGRETNGQMPNVDVLS